MPLVVVPQSSTPTAPTADPNTQSYTNGYVDAHFITPRTPSTTIDLNPPKVPKLATASPNYQTRWEREKAKARAEGTDIEGGDPKMIGPWVIGEMLGRGASGMLRFCLGFLQFSSLYITSVAKNKLITFSLCRSCSVGPPLLNWQDGSRKDS